MEVFVFPELIYSLLLANLMSPRIWPWRDDPWFKNLARLKPGRRLQRLKQFIMDHYVFNLDLNTWGLTTKAREMARFGDFIDTDALRQSNALFGYEGDKYYFDIDIRTHFGLTSMTATSSHTGRLKQWKQWTPSGTGRAIKPAPVNAFHWPCCMPPPSLSFAVCRWRIFS